MPRMSGGMNWIRWVAGRYLRAKRNTRFLSLSTALSMGGVGLGVAAIIIVLAVMNGFERQLREKLVSSELHVLMHPTPDLDGFDQGLVPRSSILQIPAVASLVSNKDVDFVSWVLGSEVVIRAGNKVSGIKIQGVEPDRIARLKKSLVEEALPQMLVDRDGPEAVRHPGVFIGKELAYELGLIPGDFVTLISPSQMDGPFNNIPRVKRFIVEGIYHQGVPEQESHIAFTTLASMESFLRKRGAVSEVQVTLKDASISESFTDRYRKELKGIRIRDWNELNQNLFASMRLERIAMFLILLFTVVISSLNIVSTLTLLVQEKLKEIAIFRTMGARASDIRGIFLWKGLLIGGAGVVAGTVGAFLLCVLLRRYQFISLPDVYYDRTLPVVFDPWVFIGVPLVSFFIVGMASWFPAHGASRLTPLQGMRDY